MSKKRRRDPLAHLNVPLESLPKTLSEAVDYVIAGLTPEDREFLRTWPCESLGQFHHGFGTGIRNNLGLWGRNPELIASLPESKRFADAASSLIIEEIWLRLQGQPSDRSAVEIDGA